MLLANEELNVERAECGATEYLNVTSSLPCGTLLKSVPTVESISSGFTPAIVRSLGSCRFFVGRSKPRQRRRSGIVFGMRSPERSVNCAAPMVASTPNPALVTVCTARASASRIAVGSPVNPVGVTVGRAMSNGSEKSGPTVVKSPAEFVKDDLRGEFAQALLRAPRAITEATAPWRQWGEGLEPEAVNQMARACRLPVSVAGALMPDAHVGYGLPIGGVLACENAVIPYAVGVDIACRMKLSVLDVPT